MIINILIILIGFVGLIKGADLFVKGSSDAAKNLKVPAVIIGLTIVALGTSAPELAVSVSAALQGSNEISVSNVVGSNIFNMLFILGVSGTVHPISVNVASVVDLALLVLVSLLTLAYSATSNRINRIEGCSLVLIYIAYVGYAIYR